MNLDLWFPTPTWWVDLDENIENIEKECNTIRSTDSGRELSNYGGWQSNDIDYQNYESINHLAETILEKSNRCLTDFGYDNCYLKMSNLWVNYNGYGNFNQIHFHIGSFLSGVFYVKTTEESSPLEFHRSSFSESYVTQSILASKSEKPVTQRITPLNATSYKYPPIMNRMIVFPSWAPHSVPPSVEHEERISIAFNMDLGLLC